MEDSELSRGISSEQYIEKGFLYLLLFSIILHVAGFLIWYKWPREEKKVPEATFIDLQDMPELKPQLSQKEPDKATPSDRRQRVAKQQTPKGDMILSRRQAAPQKKARPSKPSPPSAAPSKSASRPTQAKSDDKTTTTQRRLESEEGLSSSSELLRKPKTQARQGAAGSTGIHPSLMPSASRMAKLEENYRRRFADDIADGDTRFLNTNDVLFGSFLRRFETAVYGVWRYPREAAMNGTEGVTPVKIVFNKDGTINFAKTRILDTSGSRVLDDEVLRTLKAIGPIGSFPKDYQKDEFNLIAFFQYGHARGRLR